MQDMRLHKAQSQVNLSLPPQGKALWASIKPLLFPDFDMHQYRVLKSQVPHPPVCMVTYPSSPGSPGGPAAPGSPDIPGSPLWPLLPGNPNIPGSPFSPFCGPVLPRQAAPANNNNKGIVQYVE